MSETMMITQSLNMMVADFSSEAELTKELREQRRERILSFEAALMTLGEAKNMKEFNEGKISHHFGTGVYGRELFIPAGEVIVSKIHRGKTMSVIAQGSITVISEEGVTTLHAPHVFVSGEFTKRIVISHTDVVWVTAHGTDKTDLDEIENEIIAKNFNELKLKEGGTL